MHVDRVKNNKKVAVFGNQYQDSNRSIIIHVFEKLYSLGFAAIIEKSFFLYLLSHLEINLEKFGFTYFEHDDFKDVDFVISIGGDGTFLHTSSRVISTNPRLPMLGVNTGYLGFLADVSVDKISDAFKNISDNNFKIEKRSLIKAMIGCNKGDFFYALNEIAMLKADISSLIRVKVNVDGAFLANYYADGVIVATPTGSTGYSLSVGGPIVSPSSQSFCIAAVAPHSLSVRPIVINDSSKITINVDARNKNYLLAFDGISKVISDSMPVELEKAPFSLNIIKLESFNFFDTLREKLKWGQKSH